MIIVFTSSADPYFRSVIEYFKIEQIPHRIISLEKCYISFVDIIEDNFCLTTDDGFDIVYNEIDFFLYRSGHLKNMTDFNSELINKLPLIEKTYLQMEIDTLLDYVYSKINTKSFGYLSQKPLNKLKQLHLANKYGLAIPKTFISNSKSQVLSSMGNSFITKAIQENLVYQDSFQVLYQRVERMEGSELPEYFFPSLFQENVNKVLELRSFYFNKKFYTIAFTSTGGRLDMRDNYDLMDYYKYVLPESIESKLNLILTELKLFSGSIDLLLDNTGKYVFLEINPEGQFDWVSKFGGYNLDEVIAAYLKQL